MAYKSFVAAGLGLILVASCKKDDVAENPPDKPVLPAYVIKTAIHTPSISGNYKYQYTFNAKAQVTERQYFFPASAVTSSSSTTYSYDGEGKLTRTKNTSTVDPTINEEEYIYDSDDRLVIRKTFINTSPSGTSTYTYNGNTISEDYAGLVKYTTTMGNAGNIIKKIAEFINDPKQNYTEEWLDYDDKPIIDEFPPSAGKLHSLNNFHKSKLTFADWDRQGYNKVYDYQYTFNADGYVTERKQYDSGTGALLETIHYELIKP